MGVMSTSRERGGQAIVEWVVALVVILVLFAGIIQYCWLGLHHSRAMAEARRQAGVDALAEASPFDAPQFIMARTAGSDGIEYSRDDGAQLDTPAILTAGIVSYGHPKDLDALAPDNPVSALDKSAMPESLFGLIQGEQKESLALLPVVSKLIYKKDSVEVRGSAWMTWTKGIY